MVHEEQAQCGARRAPGRGRGAARRAWALALVCGVSFGGVAPALAQGPPRVAVLGIEAANLPEAVGERLTRAVRGQVSARSDLLLVARDAVSLSEAELAFSCVDQAAECLAAVGDDLGAQTLVYGKARASQGGVLLSLFAIDVAAGTEAARQEALLPRDGFEPGAAELTQRLLQRPGPASQATVQLTILQAGARVYVDGRLVAQAPLSAPLPIEPGDHDLRVSLDDFEDWSQRVQARPGASLRYTVSLRGALDGPPGPLALRGPGPEPTPLAPMEAGAGTSRQRSSVLAWTLLGSGVLVLGGGAVFGVLTNETQKEFDEEAGQRRSDDLAARGRQFALTANVLYGLGGALLVSGGVLLVSDLLSDPGPQARQGLPASGTAPRYSLQLLVAPTSLGLAGSF